jgi:predicted nucleotidyltransferase
VETVVATKHEVISRLRQHRDEIRSLGVEKLGLFGSFAREEQVPGSDVDILVEFRGEEKSFDNFMQLAFLLEDLLQRPVELLTPQALSPYLGPRILDEVQDVPLGH